MIPEFAIVGHPNEGKSSVVSTLAEDDSVRISPVPGETIQCQTFPVSIDGQEIIKFTDTPGFQNPKQTLDWMKNYQGEDNKIVEIFCQFHKDKPDFRDDCELFSPIVKGAGIIYVVDGSRPLRSIDKAEMEILRLTGRPRMAIINCKEEQANYLDQWKNEFRKHFNSVRVFNAHKATYAERIELLESLKSIDQDWQPCLEKVILAFKKDWEYRNTLVVDIMYSMFIDCLQFSIARNFTDKSKQKNITKKLQDEFNRSLENKEKNAHKRIRKLFKHNIFKYDLPAYSILNKDLFNEKTWQLLGLTQKQLITAASIAGGAIGAAIDVAAAGLTFGIFTAIGGVAGAGWAALGGAENLAKSKIVGISLGGQQIKIGPVDNIQFFYILMDRALIFYSHIINWAHGRRDYPLVSMEKKSEPVKSGFTAEWDEKTKKICINFFKAVRNNEDINIENTRELIKNIISNALIKISCSERKYGLMFKK